MTTVVSPPPAARVERPQPALASQSGPSAPRDPEGPRNEPQPKRREVTIVIAQGLTIFGLIVAAFVVYLVGISALEHGRSQRTLRATLNQDINFGNAWIGGQIPQGAPVAQIEIPKLGVSEIVVEGTTGGVLKNGPGHLRSSALPGQIGNTVIAGRRVAYGGPFRHIDRLRPGDRIVTSTGQGRSVYRVTRAREISRDAPDALDDFGDNRLTLLSSAPEFAASRRLVVTALLQTPLRPIPAVRPTDIRKPELALHSDGSSAYALLLWAQALLVACLATAWLHRRWRRWPTYLVALPVLALLMLLVFDSFTPVLPSTL